MLGGGGAAYVASGNTETAQALGGVRTIVADVQADGASFSTLSDQLPAFGDVTSQTFDAAAYDSKVTEALGILREIQEKIAVDRHRLARADDDITSACGWQTLPQRGRLDDARRRVGFAKAGIGVSDRLVKLLYADLESMQEFARGADAYTHMSADLDRGQNAAAAALYPTVKDHLDAATAAAKGAAFRPVYAQVLAGLDKIARLTRDVAQALAIRDFATANSKAADLRTAGQDFQRLHFGGVVDTDTLSSLNDEVDADFAKSTIP